MGLHFSTCLEKLSILPGLLATDPAIFYLWKYVIKSQKLVIKRGFKCLPSKSYIGVVDFRERDQEL